MSHDRRYQQAQDDEYYNSRSSSRRANGNYDDQQGNPYGYYDQQQRSDYGHGYNDGGHGRDQQVANRDRDRYARSDDDDDVGTSEPYGRFIQII